MSTRQKKSTNNRINLHPGQNISYRNCHSILCSTNTIPEADIGVQTEDYKKQSN